MDRKLIVLCTTAVVSFFGGTIIGYALVKRRLEDKIEQKYEEYSRQSIAEAKKFYSALYKKDAFATPEMAVETLQREPLTDEELRIFNGAVEALTYYKGERTSLPIIPKEEVISTDSSTDEIPDQEETRNIFGEGDVSRSNRHSYEDEVRERDRRHPYVISKEEFFENSTGYNQVTLTFYSGDGILTDDKDQPFTDYDANKVVNLDVNSSRFGDFSGDKRVLYIRNENLQLEIELLRSEGTYSEEVLGFVPDRQKRRPMPSNAGGEDG